MRDKHIIYEHREKYRAETFRFAGYALCTPFCMIILRLLLEPVKPIVTYSGFWIQFFIALILAVSGYHLIRWGNTIMVELDESLSYGHK